MQRPHADKIQFTACNGIANDGRPIAPDRSVMQASEGSTNASTKPATKRHGHLHGCVMQQLDKHLSHGSGPMVWMQSSHNGVTTLCQPLTVKGLGKACCLTAVWVPY